MKRGFVLAGVSRAVRLKDLPLYFSILVCRHQSSLFLSVRSATRPRFFTGKKFHAAWNKTFYSDIIYALKSAPFLVFYNDKELKL